jgi:hypothetical protein
MKHNEGVKPSTFFSLGIAMYAVIYLAAALLATYNISETWYGSLIALAVLVIVGLKAGYTLQVSNVFDVLPYSLGWVGLVFVFDLLLIGKATDFLFLVDPGTWGGYALLGILPVFAHYMNRTKQLSS